MSSPPEPLPGPRLYGGRYRVERLIGRGGMAEVFLARDERTAGLVAVKTIRPERIKDRRVLQRFAVEVHALASVEHPNVVQLLDAGVTDELPFLVMELVAGPSLGAWVRDRGALEPRLALELMRQAGLALSAMHEDNILHRDVKPANVLLAVEDGRPVRSKVTDLGLAKLPSIRGLTRTGAALGSPTYMAPEQVVGDVPDARSDVYGWGMCLFKALTGERPFEGSRVAVMKHQLRTASPPPSWFVDELGDELDVILTSALRKHPNNRYDSMATTLRDVDAVLQGTSFPKGARLAIDPDRYVPKHVAARQWVDGFGANDD